MKRNTLALFGAVAAAAGLFLAGCSTPATRIGANPEAFAQLNPQQQALVRAGQVSVGMPESAVELALGHPDRVTTRTTAQGTTEIWHYVEYDYNGMPLYTGYYFHPGWYRHGWWGMGAGYPWYLDYPNRTVHDRIRVELTNGVVTSVSRDD